MDNLLVSLTDKLSTPAVFPMRPSEVQQLAHGRERRDDVFALIAQIGRWPSG